MGKIQLIKKEYLGEGYVHEFERDSDGLAVYIPCTKLEYERLGLKGGSKFNPVMEGHEWRRSHGGTVKVDNPDGILKKGEYTEVGDMVLIGKGKGRFRWLPKEKVINDSVDVKDLK